MTHEKNMIDYIDWIEDQGTNPLWVLDEIIGQRNFLKSPPKLGDFVPCTKDGEVMEKPGGFKSYLYVKSTGKEINWESSEMVKCKEYQSALDRVLWKGWEYDILSKELKNGHVKIWWKDAMIGIYNSVSGRTQIVNSNYNELITSGIKLERIQGK